MDGCYEQVEVGGRPLWVLRASAVADITNLFKDAAEEAMKTDLSVFSKPSIELITVTGIPDHHSSRERVFDQLAYALYEIPVGMKVGVDYRGNGILPSIGKGPGIWFDLIKQGERNMGEEWRFGSSARILVRVNDEKEVIPRPKSSEGYQVKEHSLVA